MSIHPLQNKEQAWVEEMKIIGYLLKSDHPVGGPKAKYFRGCGFSSSEWVGFADALRHHAKHNLVSRVKTTAYATNYSVDCNLPTPDKTNPCIRTVWEIRADDQRPRLITAHPLD